MTDATSKSLEIIKAFSVKVVIGPFVKIKSCDKITNR